MTDSHTIQLTTIHDIVPYILEHAKTLPLLFDGSSIEDAVGSYEFADGCETWFPINYEQAIDFEAAMQDKAITYVTPKAFYGSYWSDEIHRYKLLWYRGEFVAINFMVGDTTSSQTLWFHSGDRARIIRELIAKYPAEVVDNEEEVYTPDTGSEISGSHYLEFVHDGTTIWAINKLPNHGGLIGARKMLLLEHGSPVPYDSNTLEYTCHGPCIRYPKNEAIGYQEFRLNTGKIIHAPNNQFKQIEGVIPFTEKDNK